MIDRTIFPIDKGIRGSACRMPVFHSLRLSKGGEPVRFIEKRQDNKLNNCPYLCKKMYYILPPW